MPSAAHHARHRRLREHAYADPLCSIGKRGVLGHQWQAASLGKF
jgi:hypothetical protein